MKIGRHAKAKWPHAKRSPRHAKVAAAANKNSGFAAFVSPYVRVHAQAHRARSR